MPCHHAVTLFISVTYEEMAGIVNVIYDARDLHFETNISLSVLATLLRLF